MNNQQKHNDILAIETAVRTILREHNQYAPTFAAQDPDFASNVILIALDDILRILGRNLHRTPARNIPRIISDVLLYEEIVNAYGRWVFTALDAIDYVFVKLPESEVLRLNKRPNAHIIGAHAETFSTDGLMIQVDPVADAKRFLDTKRVLDTKRSQKNVPQELQINLREDAGNYCYVYEGTIVAARLACLADSESMPLRRLGVTSIRGGHVDITSSVVEWHFDGARDYAVILTIEV